MVNTKGSATGKFTFSAADSGEHRLCFLPSTPGGGGWLSGGQTLGGIKLTLDLAIGETSQIESTDKGKIQDMVQKVRDLNGRLQDIRREQVFQRVRTPSKGNRCIRQCLHDDVNTTGIAYRNAKPSFGISRSRRMRAWSDGLCFNSLFWVSLAPGSCRTFGPFSSSRN